MKPRLVAVAHGTRHSGGPRVVGALLRRVREGLPDVDVVESYVELCEPTFAAVMDSAAEPSVVVPLLLSTGYHVTHDLPASAALSPAPVTMARPLGPDLLLAEAGVRQLRAAGASRDDAVVLVVAGSEDPEAAVDAEVAGRLLRDRWAAPVRLAFLSGAGPTVPEVMEQLRAEGHARIAASPYLLAPGRFASRAGALALAHGATTVADVLGQHPLLADLVVARYLAASLAPPPSEDASRRPRVA